MWPFKKSKQATTTATGKVKPNAVKDYYQTARPQPMWLVWLLSIATFIITVVIVLAIFWAGRWVVQKVTEPEPKVVAPTAQKEQNTNQLKAGSAAQSKPTSNDNSSAANSHNGTANNSTKPTATAPNPTPPAGASSQLINTGPTSDE